MQNLIDIKNKLQTLKKNLKEQYGIEDIAIFGSYARGEETIDSDVDITILSMKRKNGFLIAKAKKYLSQQLNMNVDLGLYDAIVPFVKKRITKDLVHV